MQDGNIKDNQITASSMWNSKHAPWQARLHFDPSSPGYAGSWSALNNEIGEWIEVDLLAVTKVTAIATQGRYDNSQWRQWVTGYSLQYSLDGEDFKDLVDGKVFPGNHDRSTVKRLDFNTPIVARYIRVVAKTWHSHISLRMELYGCR